MKKKNIPTTSAFSLRPSTFSYDLCVITEEVPAKGLSHLETARQAIAGGANIIQFREKQKGARECLEIAVTIRDLCREQGVIFIVNDRLDIALLAEADGVHLGQEDLPAPLAKNILQEKAPRMLLGISTHSLEQAQKAEKEGADYIGLGPIFPTASKETGYSPLGTKIIIQVKKAVDLPLLAISGINAQNAPLCIQAGADGVAVISAVSRAQDLRAAAKELREQVKQAKKIL